MERIGVIPIPLPKSSERFADFSSGKRLFGQLAVKALPSFAKA